MFNNGVDEDNDYCDVCDRITNWAYPYSRGTGDTRCCEECGTIDPHWKYIDYTVPFEKKDPWAKWWTTGKEIISEGDTRGRYRAKFHFNERISQWLLYDPPIPDNDYKRIYREAETGKYGPINTFTRSRIIMILRHLKLNKHRERWKNILNKMTGLDPYETYSPNSGDIKFLEETFEKLVNVFYKFSDIMGKSIPKKGSEPKRRHNFPSYNYIIRKMLEMRGIRRFHREFPVPRSDKKLHIIDDVMEEMCRDLGLPFSRSTVIKRPKIKKK